MKHYILASPTDFTSENLTGAHKRFLELLNSLQKNNSIILLSGEIPQIEMGENVTHISIATNDIGKLPSHISSMFHILRGIMKIPGQRKKDWVISFSPYVTICFWLMGFSNIVSLFRENLIDYLEAIHTSAKKIKYFRIQERLAVKGSKKIIVQCEFDKRRLLERMQPYYGDLSEKVFVQVNNVNTSWMEMVHHTGSESEIVQIVFVGQFSDCRKGHHILLPAVKRLIDNGYPISLWVAGGGKKLNEYQEQYQSEKIVFLGHVSNIQHLFEKSDLLIVPSLIDSCPNVILEGLNAGIAVYGTNSSGIAALLENPRYMFEPTEDSIYAFLSDITDSKRYLEDAKHQRKIIDRLTFDWSKRIEEIIVR